MSFRRFLIRNPDVTIALVVVAVIFVAVLIIDIASVVR